MLHAPTPRQAAVMAVLERGEARPGAIAAELGWRRDTSGEARVVYHDQRP